MFSFLTCNSFSFYFVLVHVELAACLQLFIKEKKNQKWSIPKYITSLKNGFQILLEWSDVAVLAKLLCYCKGTQSCTLSDQRE